MTNSQTWKTIERAVAEFLAPGVGRRTPLSGANSGHNTSSDCLNVGVYAEVKYRLKHTVYTLFDDTRTKALKEKLLPVVCLKEKHRQGFLIVIDSRDFDRVTDIIKNQRMMDPMHGVKTVDYSSLDSVGADVGEGEFEDYSHGER